MADEGTTYNGKTYHGVATNFAAPRVVPDVNPVDNAIARLFATAEHVKQFKDVAAVPDHNTDLRDRVARLENLTDAILYSLNNATIDAVCNEDSTITVTLTLPDLPE